MSKQLFTNNASAVLTAAISASSTTIEITNASSFPVLENQNFFLLTIFGNDANGKESEWEIVKCVAKSVNSVTVVRGVEGTVAKAWPLNTKAELRFSAGFANQSSDHFFSVANPHSVTKAQVGLANAENTADAAKPVSTAQASAIATAVSTAASDATTKANAARDAAIAASTPLAHVGAAGSAHAVVTTAVAGFMSGADKTKLDGIATGANNYTYTHPVNHPASVITQDASNRFVTDAEKTAWNSAGADATSKANAAQAAAIAASTPSAHVGSSDAAHALVTLSVAGFMSPEDKTKLDGIPNGGASGNFAPDSHVAARGDSVHGVATQTIAGFMSAGDKLKLDGLPNGAAAVAVASKTIFGGVIIGDGLYVDANGRISVDVTNAVPRTDVAVSNDIGIPGGIGFGQGICPTPLPSGFTAMTGTNDISHANYGNYTFTDGSVMVYIPSFYYKIGTGANGFALNRIAIKSLSYFASLASANASGYAMHAAFYSGTTTPKLGFFIDKYSASPNSGNTAIYSSVIGKSAVSTTPADVLNKIKARSAGYCQSMSVYVKGALAMLHVAHGQAATSTQYCGWYMPTANHPKFVASFSSTVSDEDGTVSFTRSGSLRTVAGSGIPFEKTTHNGQLCGVTDYSGDFLILESLYNYAATGVRLGPFLANPFTYNPASTSFILAATAFASAPASMDNFVSNNFYQLSSLANYITRSGTSKYVTNVNAQIFSENTSGNNWLLTCAGLPHTSYVTAATLTKSSTYHEFPIADLVTPTSGAASVIAMQLKNFGIHNYISTTGALGHVYGKGVIYN